MERRIQPTKNNDEKRNTYAMLKGRYTKAVKYGFSFEAMSLAYALIEDRLRSFLLYIGALDERDSFKVTRNSVRRTDLKMIAEKYPDKKGVNNLGITAITAKIRLIRATLLWAEDQVGNPESEYLKVIKSEYERCLDNDALLKTLEDIESFCAYRNEVIHAAFNKNYMILDSGISYEVEKVMEAERFLELQINALKRSNKIRKKMNMKKI